MKISRYDEFVMVTSSSLHTIIDYANMGICMLFNICLPVRASHYELLALSKIRLCGCNDFCDSTVFLGL